MPGFLTHWRILLTSAGDVAARYGGEDPLFSERTTSLALPHLSASALGARVPSIAYLGAVGPDLPYLAGSVLRANLLGKRYTGAVSGKSPWADLLHYNRSGDFLVEVLRMGARSPSPDIQQRALAYVLGYVTHIAGDIVVHPFVNSFAGAYHDQTNPKTFLSFGMHFWVETCQDAWTARRFFGRRVARIGRQHWDRYLDGAATDLTLTSEGGSLLSLLQKAAQAVYGLDEQAATEFRDEYLAGLKAMTRFLAGSGYYRALYLALRLTPHVAERFLVQTEATSSPSRELSLEFDTVVAFASRVASRLCRLIVDYFESLVSRVSADIQEARYEALRADLRNWDLDTGYYLEVAPGGADHERTRLQLRHSWYHFLDLASECSAQPA